MSAPVEMPKQSDDVVSNKHQLETQQDEARKRHQSVNLTRRSTTEPHCNPAVKNENFTFSINHRFVEFYEKDKRRLHIRSFRRIEDHPARDDLLKVLDRADTASFKLHSGAAPIVSGLTNDRDNSLGIVTWKDYGYELQAKRPKQFWAKLIAHAPPPVHVRPDAFVAQVQGIPAGISLSDIDSVGFLNRWLCGLVVLLYENPAHELGNYTVLEAVGADEMPTPEQLAAYRTYGNAESGVGYLPRNTEHLLVAVGLLWIIQDPSDRAIPPFWQRWLAEHEDWAIQNGFPTERVAPRTALENKRVNVWKDPEFRFRARYCVHGSDDAEAMNDPAVDAGGPGESIDVNVKKPRADDEQSTAHDKESLNDSELESDDSDNNDDNDDNNDDNDDDDNEDEDDDDYEPEHRAKSRPRLSDVKGKCNLKDRFGTVPPIQLIPCDCLRFRDVGGLKCACGHHDCYHEEK